MNNLIKEMKDCYQIKDKQTVFQHGVSVYNFYKDLFNIEKNKQWKLPEWFEENLIWIKNNIHNNEIIKYYTIFHDCGKPQCQFIDEFG